MGELQIGILHYSYALHRKGSVQLQITKFPPIGSVNLSVQIRNEVSATHINNFGVFLRDLAICNCV